MFMETTYFWVRIYFAVLFTGAFGFLFRDAWKREHGRKRSALAEVWGLPQKDTSTSVVFGALLFPLYFALLFAFALWQSGWRAAVSGLFHAAAGMLLTMSLYYTVLLLLMPALRRHFCARACATAWLLPTYLYYTIAIMPVFFVPHVVVYCPAKLTRWLIPVWFGVFLLLFAGAILSHLRLRRRILSEAFDECDENVRTVWVQEMERIGWNTPVRLLCCAHASTPFSIGMGNGKRVLTVLPARPYTEDELRLIFRHELHHIQRNDAASKLFFAFLRALFWFHPLVWIAAREFARDMELSCDEIVLEDAGQDTRERYAALLLHSAEVLPGFTTCLSADARSLRYRLKHIMRGHGRRRGTVFLMTLLFICVMCHSAFAFTDERSLLGEVMDASAVTQISCEVFDKEIDAYRTLAKLDGREAEEILSDLCALPVERLAGLSGLDGRYAAMEGHTHRICLSDAGDARQTVFIYDKGASVYSQTGTDERVTFYYIREAPDWERIEALSHTYKEGGPAHE